jgi:hypothetical protein
LLQGFERRRARDLGACDFTIQNGIRDRQIGIWSAMLWFLLQALLDRVSSVTSPLLMRQSAR